MKILLVVRLKPEWPNSWRWKLFVEMARIINAFSVTCRGYWTLHPPSSKGTFIIRNIILLYTDWRKSICRPREFLECVCHVRLLSWLLLGALQHTALVTHTHSNGPLSVSSNNSRSFCIHLCHHSDIVYFCFFIASVTSNPCLPLPIEVSCSLADHIQGILAGFAEQSKTSVLHMSSLYHAFLLCQVRLQFSIWY